MEAQNIYDLEFNELSELLVEWRQPTYRAQQIWEGLYTNLWEEPDQFTNLPKELRKRLEERFASHHPLTGKASFAYLYPSSVLESSDGETQKIVFKLKDDRLVEVVRMSYTRRCTLCISTQSGCAMGCVFCATGQMGFGRHLTSGEIVEQVLFYARQLASKGESVTNVVLMGMGEPFHNYKATMSAVQRLNDPQGFHMGARHFIISTVGLVPGIIRFTKEHSQVNLAVSLHTVDDELRSSLLPINRKYPLEELFTVCQEYIQQNSRRLSFEWALIEGINDTPEQARHLADWLGRLCRETSMLCHVNVIPLNPTDRYPQKGTSHSKVRSFCNELMRKGIPYSLRLRRGIDIQAGCGQLAGKIITP